MQSKSLFQLRMSEDVKRRSYYNKYIFNSHFLIFLTITIGVSLYTLLNILNSIEYNMWFNIVAVFIVSITLLPNYRSLLKRADSLYLLPFEYRMKDYFKQSDRYSFLLNITWPIISTAVASIILSSNYDLVHIAIFILIMFTLLLFNFVLAKNMLQTSLNRILIRTVLLTLNFSILILTVYQSFFVIMPAVLYIVLFVIIQKNKYKVLNWQKWIQYEENEMSKYFKNVSLFTNVHHIENHYKRRSYLDFLLWQPRNHQFHKKNMYEFMFYRTFFRDQNLPSIILRLFIIFTVIMVWLNVWYASLIIGLFFIYIVIMQLSQIYSTQAYLLWPKVWPVSRENIIEGYIKFSNKISMIIGVIMSIVFIFLHIEHFFVAIILPFVAIFLNQYFSKSIYIKEQALSD